MLRVRTQRRRPSWRASLAVGSWFGWVAGAICLVVMAGCSESKSSSGGCGESADCARLTVCREAACTAIECIGAGQCNLDEVCAPHTDAKSYCTPQECTPGNPGDCAEGLVCSGGLCVQPCTKDGDCGVGFECELNICRPSASGGGGCTGDACTGKPCTDDAACGGLECISGQCLPAGGCVSDSNCSAGQRCDTVAKICVDDGDATVGEDAASDTSEPCTPGSCGDGQVCNEESGECEAESTPGESGSCQPCTGVADCDEGTTCIPLGGAQYCLKACGANGDCTTGYKCVALPGADARCVPGGGSCDKPCIQNGCSSGQACDFATGDCVKQLLACDSCAKDDLCGPGARCVLWAPSDRRCMPECKDDACPSGSTCQEKDGVDVCVPTGNACCYGESCGAPNPCDNCPGSTPYCWQGACVECLNATHCPGGTCNQGTKTCELPQGSGCEPACVDPMPYCHPQLQQCVQCFNSSQCPEDQLCTSQNQCAGTEDICQFCVAPYPACADIGGQKQCVQCVTDPDCPSGQCDETTYFCEGSNIPSSGSCKSDADCPLATQFVLKCDTSSGLCYDVEGRCDNVTAYCNGSTGSLCISVFDLLGAGGALPPELGAFGFCTCNPLADLCAAIPGLCGQAAPAKCFGALQCDLLTSLLSSFLGGATGSPEFNGTSFCGP